MEGTAVSGPLNVMAALWFLALPGPVQRPPSAPVQTVILVVGAPGTPDYAEQFRTWYDLWRQAADRAHLRFVTVGLQAPASLSDRERLRALLAEEAAAAEAPLWLLFMGHGTYDGRVAKFNLRGPDLAAEDLAAWLRPVERPLIFINTTAASAPFIASVSAPGRVVITATKSGFEQSLAYLGRFLAQAIDDRDADLDRDGQTSLLEAFLAASHRVEQFYAQAGRIATEHALLDDNGDRLGTPAQWFRGIRPTQKAADQAPLDGYRAHQIHLCPSAEEARLSAEQRAERDRLERAVFKLRDTRDQYTEEAYFQELESLLLAIARIYQESADPAP
jgi:hypothetical protein